MIKKWEKLSSKRVFTHPRIEVFEDIVKLPNGKVTDYVYLGKTPGGVVILALDDKGHFLIQKEYSYPPDEVLYQLPGGGIKKKEKPLQAAKRELSEEANLTGDFKKIGWYYADNRRKSDKVHVFLATNLSKSAGKKDMEEEIEDFWLTKEEINKLIISSEFSTYSGLAAWAIFNCQ